MCVKGKQYRRGNIKDKGWSLLHLIPEISPLGQTLICPVIIIF